MKFFLNTAATLLLLSRNTLAQPTDCACSFQDLGIIGTTIVSNAGVGNHESSTYPFPVNTDHPMTISNFATTGATVSVGSANAGTFDSFDGPWVAKYTGGDFCAHAHYDYDRTTTVKVVFTSDDSEHGTTEVFSDGCNYFVRYKCYCTTGDTACNVSNLLGQNIDVSSIVNEETGSSNSDHPVDIDNLGGSGTTALIGVTNGGGFLAVDGETDVVYNLGGDSCGTYGGTRTTRFRVIYTDDPNLDGTLTASEWRCRYHVDYKCLVPSTSTVWDGSWYITYDSADLADGVLTSSYLTKPGVDASTDITVAHTEGTCASGGAAHGGSVITATTSTATVVDDTIDDTLDVAKTLDSAVIASDYSGSFVFCETVTLKNGLVNVVDVQTQYTVTANFLATIGAYTTTLEDVSSVTTVAEQSLSIDGTVAVARCDGATDNVNQGENLCFEISESDSTSIGVESIYNLDLTQGVTTFAAINDGTNGYTDLVSVDCTTVPGTCTVNVVVPSSLFVDDSGSGATTFTLDISGDVYLYNMSGKDSESEPKDFGISVQLEKTCDGGFLRGIASMLPN